MLRFKVTDDGSGWRILLAAMVFSLPAALRAEGGASVSGRVSLDGVPPPAKSIRIDEVMKKAAGRETTTVQFWKVGKENGLADCVVTLRAKNAADRVAVKPVEDAIYTKEFDEFVPHVLVVTAGTTVTMRNKNSPCRGFVTASARHQFNYLIDAGKEERFTFTHADTCPVTCGVRPYMQGFIVVVDTPYYAITDKDGRFTIANVPPGEYEVKVWHSEAGRLPPEAGPQSLTVKEKSAEPLQYKVSAPGHPVPAKPVTQAEAIEAALARGLPLVAKAAESYPAHRNCFSCHHQTLPVLAMVTAGRNKETWLQAQAEFTHKTFRDNHDDLKAGRGVGGRAMTVAYALWALRLADWKPDATTAAMVAYLLKLQHKEGYWSGQATRPPLEESYFMATALAVQGMKHYGTAELRTEIDAALAKAKTWLSSASVKSQEDKNARLWGLFILDGKLEDLQAARDAVVSAQRPDGGWGQTDDLASDAYATGQALYILRTTGSPADERIFQRGVTFLLKTQCDDGSWFVKSRSVPVQKNFDNGDPHGKNQFISTPASCWALAALALAK